METKFKELLKRLFVLLKPLGYKKDGQNFRLFQENNIGRIINFQKNRFNTKDEISFTINVGIYDLSKDNSLNLKFKEYECYFGERPACESLKYRRDKWWTITSATNMDTLYNELAEFFESDVLPCLDKLENKMQNANFFKNLKKTK